MRPKSQFNKKIISRFSKGVKSQQKAKTLIRSGIPDAHRGILNIFYNNGGGSGVVVVVVGGGGGGVVGLWHGISAYSGVLPSVALIYSHSLCYAMLCYAVLVVCSCHDCIVCVSGEVWWACSGGAELMEASKQSYADYIQLAAATPG